jgi:cytochrome c553
VTAHQPWITTLDGRDPRPVYGNYAARHLRPDMILDVRAIPGSTSFVGTAAPHHGQAFGSLVLLDPQVPDDDRTAPLRRLTPEEGFPETQDGAHSYGTPWPLSERYYLCAYDVAMRDPALGFQGREYVRGEYGLYLVDVFGNRELLYRDPNIASLNPIPLRRRPSPPVLPALAQRGPETVPANRPPVGEKPPPALATVAVMNVYASRLPWPEATRIRALRIVQAFPMSVPSGEPPHETGLRIAGAGDSVVPVRHVLGTVPVEADGSAHFRVPAHRSIFFQALDEHGLAVQSMRSSTYLHEGETASCVGCHEPGHRAPLSPAIPPLALQRPPSEITPDVEGSRPFSYARLVQPVLDRHCVSCHEQHADQAPNLGREPIQRKWYASYNNLAPQWGFHDYGDPYRTLPGRFGARASKLYQHLQADHHGVALSTDDWHRLTLWLDLCSMFYGVYEAERGEAQLRGELAWPTLE